MYLGLEESKKKSIESSFLDDIHKALAEDIWVEENNLLSKGKEALPIGTERNRGNVTYVKTAQGWEVKKKNKGAKSEDGGKRGLSNNYEKSKNKPKIDHAHEADKAAMAQKIHSKRVEYDKAKKAGDNDKTAKIKGELESMKPKWEDAKNGKPSKDSEEKPKSTDSKEGSVNNPKTRGPKTGTQKHLDSALKKRASNPKDIGAYNKLQNSIASRLTKEGMDAGVASKASEKMMDMPEVSSGTNPDFTNEVISEMAKEYKADQNKKAKSKAMEVLGSTKDKVVDKVKGSEQFKEVKDLVEGAKGKWDKVHETFFKNEQNLPKSELRQEAKRMILKGAAVIRSAVKAEAKELKSFAEGIKNFTTGKDVTPEQKEAIKTVSSQIAIAAAFAIASGGVGAIASGAKASSLLGTTWLKKAALNSGKALALAKAIEDMLIKAEGEMSVEEAMNLVIEQIADSAENSDISSEEWADIISKSE